MLQLLQNDSKPRKTSLTKTVLGAAFLVTLVFLLSAVVGGGAWLGVLLTERALYGNP